MTEKKLRALLERVQQGKVGVGAAVGQLKHLPFEDLGFAKIDHHRALRQGMPEVILGRGKRPEQVVSVVKKMLRASPNVLVTRGDESLYRQVRKAVPAAKFHSLSGAITIQRDRTIHGRGKVLVISAGTSDIPVAEEAQVTAQIMGNPVEVLYDVGVAGIHPADGQPGRSEQGPRHHLRGRDGRRAAQRGGGSGRCAGDRRAHQHRLRLQFPRPGSSAWYAQQLRQQRRRGQH